MSEKTLYETALNYATQYQQWWLEELEHKPTRVIFETIMIIFVIYLLFKRPSSKKVESDLTSREVEDLLNDWKPEPLVNMDNARRVAGGQSDPVLIKSKLGSTITTNNDEELIDFVTFDFLGFSCDDDVKKECIQVLDDVGCGSCGPRGFYGTLDQHLELEKTIADLFGVEESIMYSDAASTVSSVIPAFAKRTDLCIVDESCYDPILTGLFLSRCRTLYFKHNDMDDLERILNMVADEDRAKGTSPRTQRRFIVVEGIYRNVGDVCNLKRVVELKEEHHVRIILDESYSFGVLGETGRGVTEHLGVPLDSVEILCGGLNTACGSVGGFSIGTEPEVVEHQKLSAAGYTYSASAPPFVCTAATVGLKKMILNPTLCRQVRDNATALHEGLNKSTSSTILDILSDNISPLCIVRLKKDLVDSVADEVEDGQNQRENMERACVQAIVHTLISEHGVFVVASKYNLSALYTTNKKNGNNIGPADPINSIRLAVSTLHTQEQINKAAQCLLEVSEQVCRDMYGDDVVCAATSGTRKEMAKKQGKTPAKKKLTRKSTPRSKSTGKKKK